MAHPLTGPQWEIVVGPFDFDFVFAVAFCRPHFAGGLSLERGGYTKVVIP